MLKPVRMSKIRAICLKAIAPSVIKLLHNMAVVHLKDAAVPETERAGPLSTYDDISSRLIRIRSMKEALPKGKEGKKKYEFESILSEADGMLSEDEKLRALLKQKEDAAKEIEAKLAAQRALADIAELSIDFSKLQSGSLQFMLLKSGADKAAKARAEVSKRKNFAFTAVKTPSGASVLLIALPKEEDAKFLEEFGQMMPLPALSSTPKHEISKLKGEEKGLREELAATQEKIAKFSERHYAKLVAIEESLSIEADRAQVSTMFSGSDSLYFIEGYLEKTKVGEVESELQKKFGKKIMVSEAKIDEHLDTPPTLLSNPKSAGPFQFIVEFLSSPKYGEIDPTLLIAFFIPILYALILGDAIYAIFSFFIATYLISISKPGSLLNNISKIWQLSAIPAFIAGVLFDEWGGFTHQHLLSKFGLEGTFYQAAMHRVSDVQSLMLLVIVVGAIQIGIGFLLGAINEWSHSKKHAYAKLAWLGIEIGGFFTVAVFMFNAFPLLSMAAPALLLLSIGVLIATEGIIGAFEIPGLASNIMSYIRIAAVGVGGVILAEAVNELLFPKFELTPLGLVFFILGAIVFLAVHMISCIIAMFEAFIHGARLNVVEFFGKFYKGNGLPFSPFKVRRVYTEEA